MLSHPPLLSLTCLYLRLPPCLQSQLMLIVPAFSGLEIRETNIFGLNVLSFSYENVHLY